MRFKMSMLSIMAVLAIVGGAAFASSAQRKPASATDTRTSKSQSASAKPVSVDHVAQGSVVAMTGQSLIIRSEGRDMTLTLNADTQKLGNIATGKQVTVHYRDENKQHVASSIQETAAQKPAVPIKSNR